MRFRDTLVLLFVSVTVLAFSAPVHADTLDVCKSGCTYSTINSAIDDSDNGDTVQVVDSEVYSENVDFDELEITIISTTKNATISVINSNAAVSIVNVTSGNPVLNGFTITNEVGAGIYVDDSSPSITNCVVEDNNDRGIYLYGPCGLSPSITNCTIQNNSNGAIWVSYTGSGSDSTPVFEDCTVDGHTGTAITFEKNADPTFNRCTISNNELGIDIIGADSKFINCLFTKNYATLYGSAIVVSGNGASSTIVNSTFSANIGNSAIYYYPHYSFNTIKNSIIWGNENGIDNRANLVVTYSDVQGGWIGEGNIENDPLFSAPEDDDFSLRCASPAIDAGTSDGAPSDDMNGNSRPYSTTDVDMGAYEYQSTEDCPVPTTLTVGDSGDYSTIQAAIDAAKDDDTILVYTGTYNENIDFKGKNLKVISEDEERPEYTIIDGGSSGNVVTMSNYEGEGTELNGFTIMEGYAASNGGGISLANFASPSITNCIITSNSGNGIYMRYSSANITDSVISDNTSEGIEAFHSNLTVGNSLITENSSSGIHAKYSPYSSFSNCTVENNSNGGGIKIENDSNYPTINNCLIKNNSGRGMTIQADSSYIVGCDIYSNSASGGSGDGAGINLHGKYNKIINCVIAKNSNGDIAGTGIFFYGNASTSSTIINSTITDHSGSGSTLHYYGGGAGHSIINSIFWGNTGGIYGSPTITYSDIQSGWTGTGNIDVDPDFVNSADGDYHLNASSSCINAGTTVNVLTDKDGNIRPIGAGYDMGAYEYTEITSDYGIISGYVMDYSDNPISSATVNLKEYHAQGSLLNTTTSDSNGYYEFNSLSNRIYIIEAEDGSLLNRRTGKTNKSLPWAMEEFINLYLNE